MTTLDEPDHLAAEAAEYLDAVSAGRADTAEAEADAVAELVNRYAAEREAETRQTRQGGHEYGPSQDDDDEKQAKKSAATLLVETAERDFDFGVTDDGETFAVPLSGPKITSLLRGGKPSLRAILARQYFKQHGKAAPQQALADALAVLEGEAYERRPTDLHLRVAEHDGGRWIDLGDETGRAIELTAEGWTVHDEAPVLFRRSALTGVLPGPERGGTLDELWQRMNVDPADRPLIAAWMVAALHPNIPHPVLDLEGEQGSGKTTAQRLIVDMIDPSPVPSRKPPRDADSWVTAAAGSWVVGLDNLSTVADWLSDSLCRAVTGDGDVRRRLYTDGDLAVFSYRRCICLTGIDLGSLNGDLSERLLPIRLAPIDGASRMEESDLWPSWPAAHPKALGALLDLAVMVDRVAPSVELTARPRMADFARIVAAVDVVLGTDGLGRYLGQQSSLAAEALTDDAFVMAMATTIGAGFEGTSAELLDRVPAPDRPPKGWPRNAREVTIRLRRQAPTMRKAGWSIDDDGGRNEGNVARWSIARPEITRNGASSGSSASSTSHTRQPRHEYATSQDDPDVDEWDQDYSHLFDTDHDTAHDPFAGIP